MSSVHNRFRLEPVLTGYQWFLSPSGLVRTENRAAEKIGETGTAVQFSAVFFGSKSGSVPVLSTGL